MGNSVAIKSKENPMIPPTEGNGVIPSSSPSPSLSPSTAAPNVGGNPPLEGERVVEEDDDLENMNKPITKGIKKNYSIKSKPSNNGGLGGGGLNVSMNNIGSITSDGGDDENGGSGDVDAIDLLFELIPYHGQGNNENDTILRSALSAASIEDIDRKDSYGNTLLLTSCQYSLETIVRILLNKGADPNALNSSGVSCLHYACYKDSLSKNITKLLLQNGANPDIQELTYGCTPLHYAASCGNIDLCKILLSYGAEVKTLDYYEYTAIDYAREGGYHELATYLQTKLLMVSSHQNMTQYLSKKDENIEIFKQVNTDDSPTKERSGSSPDILVSKSSPLPIKLKSNLHPNVIPHITSSSSIITPVLDNHSLPEPSPRNNVLEVSSPPTPPRSIINENWIMQIDITTNEKYYMNTMTGECLWEVDYLRQRDEEKNKSPKVQGHPTPNRKDHQGNQSLNRGNSFVSTPNTSISNDQHAKLMTKSSFKLSSNVSNEVVVLQEEIVLLKNKIQEMQLISEQILEKTHAEYRQQLLEKEMKLVQYESNYQKTLRENERLEAEILELKKHLDTMNLSGDEALKSYQNTIQLLETERNNYRHELMDTKSTLEITESKLKSLQDILQNLESSQTEKIEMEKVAAELRAKQLQERENQHKKAIHELEISFTETKNELMSEIRKLSDEKTRAIKDGEMKLQTYRRQRDEEMNRYTSEMNEKIATLSREHAMAQKLAEESQKAAHAAEERANIAEAAQRAVMREIEEAREIEKYNSQLHRDLIREQKLRKQLHNEMEDMKGRIRVYVRIRPLSQNEIAMNSQEAVVKDGKMSVLVLGHQGPDSRKNFDFDQVFGGSSKNGNSQLDIFRDTKHLMLSVIDGYNVCIFAYGQTGSGKTFTMIGGTDLCSAILPNNECHELAGIAPRAVSEIFRLLNERQAQCISEVNVQMFQLYRDGLEDLLQGMNRKKGIATDPSKRPNGQLKITLAEHSPTGLVHVEGAESILAESAQEVMSIFQAGAARRTTASTQMNAESSRSHLICSLVITLTNRKSGVVTTGKLTLVDLAGSERVDKSGATGEVLKEAQSINKSLSAIGDVIAALTSDSNHIPYRNHPLTMLMSDSLGGNAKTLMFVNCSPANYNISESNSSLTFALRCKDIKNNTASSATSAATAIQLNALKKELNKLKKDKGVVSNNHGSLARPT